MLIPRRFLLAIFFLIQWSFLFSQNAAVLHTVPADEAKDTPCKTFITVKVQFPDPSIRVDPLTLHGNAIKLYPLNNPSEQVGGALYYLFDEDALRMDPLGELKPLTTYVFEITAQLKDDKGESFKPFSMSFTSGDCMAAEIEILAEADGEGRGMPKPSTEVTPLEVIPEGMGVMLKWATRYEFMNADFSVDRSGDGSQFEILDRVPSLGDSEEAQYYQWSDSTPLPGWNYYRLTQVDIYGSILQTDTISVFLNGVQFAEDRIARNGSLTIQFIGKEKTSMALIIKSSTGKIVKRKAGFVPGGTQKMDIPLTNIPPGKYMAILKTSDRALAQEIVITPP